MKTDNMFRSFLLLLISTFLLISGCKPLEEVLQRKVMPVPASGLVPDEAIVYALPRTVLGIHVEFVKVIQKKGPFYNYRKKYLGLKEGISADRSYWKISKVEVSASEEIDPARYYMIRSVEPVYSSYLHLTQAGLIMSPLPGLFAGYPGVSNLNALPPALAYFTDLSVKRNINQVTDTAFKLVATDTGFIKVPYVEYKNRLKTGDEKAEEAADFIIKVRKRRFKLLSGQYDVFPEGTALEYAVNKMNKLEEEYLALFLGKTVKQYYKRSFEWVPETGRDIKELFRFSEKNGLTTKNDPSGMPVIIKVENTEVKPLQDMVQPGDSIDTSALIYRVPVPTTVAVQYGKKNLITRRFMVDQFGILFRLPSLFVPASGAR